MGVRDQTWVNRVQGKCSPLCTIALDPSHSFCPLVPVPLTPVTLCSQIPSAPQSPEPEAQQVEAGIEDNVLDVIRQEFKT